MAGHHQSKTARVECLLRGVDTFVKEVELMQTDSGYFDPEGLASRQPVWILCCRDVPQVCVVVDPQPWSLKMESDRSLLASVRDDGFKQLRICVWV